MQKKLFISSVQSEFETERSRLAEYIRQDALLSRYFVPFLFEELPATDVSARRAYLEEAEKTDVYLLLMGTRYGYIDEAGVSPTEREYDTASAHHAYRIAMLKEVSEREEKEQRFVNKVEQDVVRDIFTSYEDLQNNVYAALVQYMLHSGLLHQGPFDASIHPTARISDLDPEKIRWFVGMAREKRQFPIQYSEENIHRILQSLHLIDEKDGVTNAALLLFAKDVQRWFISATIKCVQFYGTKVGKPLLSQQLYSGSVFEVVDQAVSFVLSRIDSRVGERTQSAQVDIEYELPVQAITEAIVNAVVHRDYNSTGSVQVMLFRDRLEIWNPGQLPHGMTIEKLNAEHHSLPVNPLLAKPVYLAGYIEQLGTGTTDLIERCTQMGLPTPAFRQDEDFTIILYRKAKDNGTGDNAGDNVSGNANGNAGGNAGGNANGNADAKILRIVSAIGGDTMGSEQIMKRMGLKANSGLRRNYLYPALDAGYIAKLYPDNDKHPNQAYYLTQKGLLLLSQLKKQNKQ